MYYFGLSVLSKWLWSIRRLRKCRVHRLHEIWIYIIWFDSLQLRIFCFQVVGTLIYSCLNKIKWCSLKFDILNYKIKIYIFFWTMLVEYILVLFIYHWLWNFVHAAGGNSQPRCKIVRYIYWDFSSTNSTTTLLLSKWWCRIQFGWWRYSCSQSGKLITVKIISRKLTNGGYNNGKKDNRPHAITQVMRLTNKSIFIFLFFYKQNLLTTKFLFKTKMVKRKQQNKGSRI